VDHVCELFVWEQLGIRYVLLWDVRRNRLTVIYRRFGATCRPHLQGSKRVQEEWVITNLKDFNFLTRPLASAAVVPTASEKQNNTLLAPHQSNEQYGGIVVSQVSIPRPLTHSVNPSFSWKLSPLPTSICFTEVLKVFVGKSIIRFSM